MKYVNNLAAVCLCLAMTGCASEYIESREPTEREVVLLDESYVFLKAAYGPSTEQCDQELQSFRFITFDTIEEVSSYCDFENKYPPGADLGCFFYDTGYAGFKGSPTIIYSDLTFGYENTFIHEITHWYLHCVLGEPVGIDHKNIIWDYLDYFEGYSE